MRRCRRIGTNADGSRRASSAPLRGDAGQALAEFVLVVPVLLLLVFGIVEFGLAFRAHQIVTNSTREGARVAVLPDATDQSVRDAVQNRLESAGLEYDESRLTLSCRDDEVSASQAGLCVGSGRTGKLSDVEYAHPYTFFILGGLVRWACGADCADSYGTIDLRTVSTMRNE